MLWRWFLGSGRIAELFSERARQKKDEQLTGYFEKRAIALRERFYREPSGEGRERILDSLGAIRDYAAQHGVELVVVIFPEQDQVEGDSPSLMPQARWREWCAGLELRCLDLHPVFMGSENSHGLFADLQHPNAAGIAAAVRATADFLEGSAAIDR